MFAELSINRDLLPLTPAGRAWLVLCLSTLVAEFEKGEHRDSAHFILDPPDPQWEPACDSPETSSGMSPSSS